MNSQNTNLHEGDIDEHLDDDRYIPKILVPIPPNEYHLVMSNTGKIWHWMKREPFIPIGIIMTVGFLGVGVSNFAFSKVFTSNWKYQAGRVGSQAFTVGAMYYYGWFGNRRYTKAHKSIKPRLE